jgi:hypothetical protein
MDKFAREKARKADIVKKQGGIPVGSGIRPGDIYLSEEDLELQRISARKLAKPPRRKARKDKSAAAASLAGESRALFSKLLLSHPDTEVLSSPQGPGIGMPGSRTVRCNLRYFDELLKAVQRRERLGSVAVPKPVREGFPAELSIAGRELFWKVFPYLKETRPDRYTYGTNGKLKEQGIGRYAIPFYRALLAAVLSLDRLAKKGAFR